jgi:transposase-like protein
MKSNKKAGLAGRRERRAFNAEFKAEFKAEAVGLVAERRALGVTLAQVGRELDVRPDQLRRRTRELRRDSESGPAVPGETAEQEVRRLRRLRREVAALRQEHAFATKVAVYFAKESR